MIRNQDFREEIIFKTIYFYRYIVVGYLPEIYLLAS